MFSCTCTHTSCYVTHARHATLLLCSLALAHTRHATLWWSSLALAHARHATLWLSWGGVGWGGAIAFMSTCTRTHTHAMLRSCYVLLHLHTHVMLRYGYLGVGLGGVGWAMTFMSTCTHTSCYVIVMFSCTCTHTHTHVMLRYGDLLLHLLTHVMLRYGYLGTIDTLPISRRTLQGRQSNEALLRRRNKSAASQKNTNLCQKTK